MDKTFKITGKVAFDDADFNRSIDQMQKKLKELYAQGDVARAQNALNARMNTSGLGGGFQPMNPGMTAQSRREADQVLMTQNRTNEATARLIAQRISSESRLSRILKENVDLSSKERAEKTEELRVLKEQTAELTKQHGVRAAAINKGLADKAARQAQLRDVLAGRGYQLGGLDFDEGGGKGPGGGGGSGESAAKGPGLAKIMQAAVMLMGAGSAIYKYFAVDQAALREKSLGGAVGGGIGREMSSVYSGKAPFESAFLGEKAKAAQIAMQQADRQRLLDKAIIATSGAAIAGGASLSLTGGGLPAGLGMMAAGGAGLATGGRGYKAAGELAEGIAKSLEDKLPSALANPIASVFHNASKSLLGTYNSIIAEGMAKTYSEVEKAIREQNPLKTLVSEQYQKDFMGNLGTQRQLGLGYNSFHGAGGYLDQITGAGFTPEMGRGMSSQILGAGGSTRGARGGGSVLGLQAERAFGVHGGQMVGQLSGTMGSVENTKQAFIKIMAESVRQGLNAADMTEEQAKFVDQITQIVYKSGATTAGDAETLSRSYGGFVADKTPRGMEAAAGAFEKFQQLGSTTSGLGGAVSAVGMTGDKFLSRLSPDVQADLMRLRPDQLSDGDPYIVAMAELAGTTPKDLIERRNRIAMKASVPMGDVQGKLKRAREGLRGRSITSQNVKSFDSGTLQAYVSAQALTGIQTGLDRPGARGFAQGLETGEMPAPAEIIKKQVEGALGRKLEGKDTGRVEDRTVQDLAANSDIIVKNFRLMRDEIIPTAEALGDFTTRMRELAIQLSVAQTPEQRTNIINQMMKERSGYPAKTQPQAGKSRR